MIGIVDCNNFYASCERVFNPGLNGKPIVILSNNDGCVIARSNEAKVLGIRMGVPAFEIKKEIEEHGIRVFSSNYTLYGDMSQRVMNILSRFAPEIEVYSIDEAFLNFNGFKCLDLMDHARQISKYTSKATGIPISVGIAPTKTLAKIANRLAKKSSASKGVYILSDHVQINAALRKFPIEDVWGVGGRYANFLERQGIQTAYDFINLPKAWVQKEMTVTGLRMWHELQGMPLIALETKEPAKKNICTSRSFGNMLSDYAIIEEALSNYAARCGEKLRQQNSATRQLMIFLHTNEYRKDLGQYAQNIVLHLPVATNSSIELIKYARKGLKMIYQPGFLYKKVGVVISDFVPELDIQQNIFSAGNDSRQAIAMKVMDKINEKLGSGKLKIGSQGFSNEWKLRQENLSPCYSTRLTDIITINV